MPITIAVSDNETDVTITKKGFVDTDTIFEAFTCGLIALGYNPASMEESILKMADALKKGEDEKTT